MEADSISLFSSALAGWDARRIGLAAVQARLPAVEWGVGPGQAVVSPRLDARVIRDTCTSLGLTVSGVSVQGGAASLTAPSRLRPFIALAAIIGAPHVRVFAPEYRGGSLSHQQRRARRGLAALAETATASGIAILIEVAPGTIAPSPTLARALVDGQPTDRVGILYDPGNMIIEGHTDPRLAIAELGPYLRHVHVKNVSWHREQGAWTWRHAALSAGMLDWRAILAALAGAGYAGWLSIDHLGGRPSLATLRRETEVLRGLAREAGLAGVRSR